MSAGLPARRRGCRSRSGWTCLASLHPMTPATSSRFGAGARIPRAGPCLVARAADRRRSRPPGAHGGAAGRPARLVRQLSIFPRASLTTGSSTRVDNSTVGRAHGVSGSARTRSLRMCPLVIPRPKRKIGTLYFEVECPRLSHCLFARSPSIRRRRPRIRPPFFSGSGCPARSSSAPVRGGRLRRHTWQTDRARSLLHSPPGCNA